MVKISGIPKRYTIWTYIILSVDIFTHNKTTKAVLNCRQDKVEDLNDEEHSSSQYEKKIGKLNK